MLNIKALPSLLQFDILAITESRLNQSISNNEIGIAGYKIATCDPNNSRKGGSSIIYFVEHLNVYERYSLEAAWITTEALIDSIYRPPENKLFLSKFYSTVDRFLPGDFNFNLLPGNQDTNSSNPTLT